MTVTYKVGENFVERKEGHGHSQHLLLPGEVSLCHVHGGCICVTN